MIFNTGKDFANDFSTGFQNKKLVELSINPQLISTKQNYDYHILTFIS